MKKKILYIVEAMGGGVFSYLVDLVNALSEKYDMYIGYAIRPQTPANFRDYFNPEIHLIEIPDFTRSVNPVKDVKAFLQVRTLVKQVQPDLVHLHSSKAGVIGRFAVNGRKIPMFYTPHGFSFLMQNQSHLKRQLYFSIEKVCALCRCQIVACSKGEYEEALRLTKNSVYINNGINIAELETKLNHIVSEQHEKTTVFTLGRICYQKNPDLFNEVAQLLPEVSFLWIGDGELRDRLTSPNITVTGWADRETALRYARNGDIFILTSLWEGLPISLLEAMYMKKLCVVSRVIGNKDVIEDNVNGYTAVYAKDYVKAIRNYMQHGSDTQVQRAYQDVLEKYNTKVMAGQYDRLYQKYLA